MNEVKWLKTQQLDQNTMNAFRHQDKSMSPLMRQALMNELILGPSNCNANSIFGGSNSMSGVGKAAVACSIFSGIAQIASIFMPNKNNKTNGAGQQTGAGQASGTNNVETAKNALSSMKNAENSYDIKKLTSAKEQGTTESTQLDNQIQTLTNTKTDAEKQAAEADKEATTVSGTIEKNTNALNDAEQSVSGDKSSSGLTSTMNSKISGVQRTNPDGTPNPNYESQVQSIRNEYQPQIEKAKKIETETIPKLKSTLESDKQKLKTLQGLSKSKTEEAKKAETQINTLTTQKTKIDAEVAKIQVRIETIQGVQQNATGTTNSTSNTQQQAQAAQQQANAQPAGTQGIQGAVNATTLTAASGAPVNQAEKNSQQAVMVTLNGNSVDFAKLSSEIQNYAIRELEDQIKSGQVKDPKATADLETMKQYVKNHNFFINKKFE